MAVINQVQIPGDSTIHSINDARIPTITSNSEIRSVVVLSGATTFSVIPKDLLYINVGAIANTATITFAANKEYKEISISSEVTLTISCSNTGENYLLVTNGTTSDWSVSISTVNGITPLVPEDGITVGANSSVEVSIISVGGKAIVTSSGNLI